MRYPRDPTLDPQLVWKGKDEQDGHDLEVPAVPIYIQETIDPLALVEELRAESEGRRTEQQLGFFGPYSDLTFEEKVDFYRHAGKWTNRMILGDSLLVMTSLAEKEGLKGQVQTIYVDPPYGIKFGSNWQVSTRKRDVRDGKDTDLTRQPEQVRAYRDTWELGIHSYLSYLRDRLGRGPRAADRVRLDLRPDRRRERAPRAVCARRDLRGRKLRRGRSSFKKTTGASSSRTDGRPARRRLHPVVCPRQRSPQVPAAVSSARQSAAKASAQYTLDRAARRE